jgi:Ser/Thr protein kinase RdoA (MazF antagonist)
LTEIGKLLGSGNVAEVHEYGDDALKLYRPGMGQSQAFHEAAVLAYVADQAIPAPLVRQAGQFEGRWGLVMSRASGPTLAACAEIPVIINEMVRLERLIHAATEPRLPILTARLASRIRRATQLTGDHKARLLTGLATLPQAELRLCHGDFHPFNIIGEPGAAMVIDWLDATSGPIEADICRSYLLMLPAMPELAAAYLDRHDNRDAILAWLPYLAAARLAEGIAAEGQCLLALAASV